MSFQCLSDNYLNSYEDTLPARVRNGIVISSLQPEIANVNILPSLLPPVFKVRKVRIDLLKTAHFRSLNWLLEKNFMIRFYL